MSLIKINDKLYFDDKTGIIMRELENEYYEVGAREDFEFDDKSAELFKEMLEKFNKATGIPEEYLLGSHGRG